MISRVSRKNKGKRAKRRNNVKNRDQTEKEKKKAVGGKINFVRIKLFFSVRDAV